MEKKIHYFLLIMLLLTFVNSSAQKLILDTLNTNYRTNLKLYFEVQSLKTKNEINTISNRKIRKKLSEIYLEKNVDFNKSIEKGIFIEHESFSKFIENIFQTIKKANPKDNFDSIKFLLAISKEINAYNCGDGIVVLNLPIIYNIDNQYQLAYIMCHEISHQKLNHVYNSIYKKCQFEQSTEIKDKIKEIDKLKYNKSEIASSLLKKIVYTNREDSRKHEKAADSLGYIYFKNAFPDYQNQALETLKKLRTIDVAKDSLSKLDFVKLFETPNLKFKEEWLTSEISEYNYQKGKRFWDIDSLRTHPNCDERISYLKKDFKIDEKLKPVDLSVFNQKRLNADYEFVFGLYFLEDYGDSLYYTLLKLKKNPTDVFYRKIVYNNLIKLQESKNKYTLNKYLEIENPKFSESYNQFLCLIRNLRKTELSQIIEFYKSKS